jgi:hypothetical protein
MVIQKADLPPKEVRQVCKKEVATGQMICVKTVQEEVYRGRYSVIDIFSYRDKISHFISRFVSGKSHAVLFCVVRLLRQDTVST